jgi:hypothetical protein
VITVLQRVCWNDKFWKAPSGNTFDSGNPGKHGFGNEERNSCTDDAVEGNVFGWLWKCSQLQCWKSTKIIFRASPTTATRNIRLSQTGPMRSVV